MMKNNRAQSALEFLTTYGWAFLVILIMIGALGYFGVLNPERYLPERCTATSGVVCDEFQFQGAGSEDYDLQIFLQNGFGSAVTLGDYSFTSAENSYTGALAGVSAADSCSATINGVAAGAGVIWPSDATLDLVCNVTTAGVVMGPEGTKVRATVDLDVLPSGDRFGTQFAIEVYGGIVN